MSNAFRKSLSSSRHHQRDPASLLSDGEEKRGEKHWWGWRIARNGETSFREQKEASEKPHNNEISCVVTEPGHGMDDESERSTPLLYVKQDGMVQGHEVLSRVSHSLHRQSSLWKNFELTVAASSMNLFIVVWNRLSPFIWVEEIKKHKNPPTKFLGPKLALHLIESNNSTTMLA